MNIVWRLKSSETVHQSYTVANVFSIDELQKIKEFALSIVAEEAQVMKSEHNRNTPTEKMRVCGIKWVAPTEDFKWVFQRLVDVINRVNSEAFNLNLYGMEPLQYTVYESDGKGFYVVHRDIKTESVDNLVRKLSFTLQLTDPAEYEGGELILDQGFAPYTASNQMGDITFFLSTIAHEVKPVTKGILHALVGWVSGPTLA
jgi:PKHD-type hydroxylase